MAVIRRPSQVTDRNAVLKAIAECDKRGREAFREKYGYGPARFYFLHHEGKTYDSKAIVGVAYGYQHKTTPLQSDEFSGGAVRVVPVLERLNFIVDRSDGGVLPGQPYLSQSLEVGEIYTRDDLRDLFSINDATINNGVFQPSGSKSIWLFVTKDKTADRPQLPDNLDGDVLEWTGQPAGLTDKKLISHEANGNEILLFYRQKRQSFAGGGFRYEGPFRYKSHAGSKPTAFIFERVKPSGIQTPLQQDEFDPEDITDGRETILGNLRRRLGQGKFRRDLLKAYGGVCCVTGSGVEAILEAAHIHPYRGTHTNDVTNGLLLRSDIHALFDLGLIAVKADGKLDLCDSLQGTEYAKFKRLKLPKSAQCAPSPKALEWHRRNIASPKARAATRAKLGISG